MGTKPLMGMDGGLLINNIQTTRDYYCRLTVKGMQDNFDRVDEKLQKTVINFNSREKLQLSVTMLTTH